MSHKSGHIIIQVLVNVPTVTPEQCTKLQEIQSRDEYSVADRIFICAIAYQVADDPAD